MNLTICLSAAFLILSHAAFCMPIRGQVKAGNKGLSHVVITDGINFTQTDTKGNFLLDTDQEARFVYLLTPDGYVADYQSGTPEFYLPLDPEKEDYIFQLTETGKRSHHTLLAIADVQTKTDEQHIQDNHQKADNKIHQRSGHSCPNHAILFITVIIRIHLHRLCPSKAKENQRQGTKRIQMLQGI